MYIKWMYNSLVIFIIFNSQADLIHMQEDSMFK